MTELLEKAVARVRALPADQQDELAQMILNIAGDSEDIYYLTADEKASLAKSLEQMERGEFAPDQEVEAVWAKYSL